MESRRRTVAFFIDQFYLGGGTERQLFNFLKFCRRDRILPVVFCLRKGDQEMARELDFPMYELGVSKLLSVGTAVAAFKCARLMRKLKVEVVQGFFMDARIFGTLAALQAGIFKIVGSRRDVDTFASSRDRLLFRLLSPLTRKTLANSQKVKSVVLEVEKCNPDNVVVVYNAVIPRADVSATGTTLRQEIGIPEGRTVVGCVANFREVKRYDLLVEVARELKDENLSFLLVGTGPTQEPVEKMARDYGLENIHFYHTVSRVDEVLSLCDIGVLGSRNEGLSNSLIEYGMAGIPAVAFDVGGNSEVIDQDRTGFLVPFPEASRMADALRKLIRDPELVRSMGGTAREHTRQKFNLQDRIEELEEFYLSI